MAKLKDLIYESKFLKREFGEPLPTFKGVMKQHQINKLKEGWWDNMSDAAQKAYIKKHGEAPDANGDDEPKVPAPDSKSDTGKPRVSANPYDDNYGQEVDDEDDYDMGEVPGSRGTGPWTPEDDPDYEHGPSLTSAPGRVPDDTAGDPEDAWDDEEGRAKPTGKTDADTDDYDMGIVPGSRELDDTPEDDSDTEKGPSLTSAPGRVPDEEDEESSGRTGKELDQETLTINGKQYRRLSEGKINTKFIKYRIYDKIADEINKVELDDFNLRDFNSLKKPLIQFIHREIKRDKKITSGDLRQAIDKSDFDDEIFGRRGVIDDWYKESKKDFATFMKKYTTYSDNPKKGWKNYNASSLTYGIGKRLYKIVDSLLDEINNIVPESVHAFAEFYQRFKK